MCNVTESLILTNRYSVFIPFHSKYTTSLGIKVRAVRRATPFRYPTSRVGIGITVAVGIVDAVCLLRDRYKSSEFFS